MESYVFGLIGFVLLVVFIVLGIPIAFAGALVGTIGLFVIGGPGVAIHFLGSLPYSEVSFYAYTALPLYILMGEFAYHGGYASGVYRTGQAWLGKLPGGMAIATVIGGAGFGAVCGASVASSAVLAKVCVPEMEKLGYDKSLSAGTVAACANLSSMIPPSGLMIVYSIFTEQSLGKLFIAGILPGILLTILFSIMIFVRVRVNPSLAPSAAELISWRKRFISLKHGLGIFLIGGVVLGGIYLGIFTPTESGAAGAFLALILTSVTRGLSWESFKNVLLSALKTTVMVLFIIVGIMVFTQFLTLSRVPIVVSEFLADLPVPPFLIICCILAFYLFLGMFFDAISMIALTIPVLFPTILSLGYDPIWFGILAVLMCEIGLITPPVGVNCYVVSGVLNNVSLEEVFKGVFPFVIMNLIAIVILLAFPKIVLFLPNLMAR